MSLLRFSPARARRASRTAVLLALLLPAAAPSLPAQAPESGAAPGEATRLRRAVHETVQTLQEARAERRNRLRSLEQQTAAARERADALAGRLASLQEEVAAARERVEALEAARAEGREDAAALKRMAGALAPALEALRETVQGGVAWRREPRAARLEALAEPLRNGGPDARGEAVVEAWTVLGDALQPAREIRLRTEPLHYDGGSRRTHGYVLRLGLAAQYFRSEDGGVTAVDLPAARKAGDGSAAGPWRLEVPPPWRAGIAAGVGVLRQTRPPALLALPVAHEAAAPEGAAEADAPATARQP